MRARYRFFHAKGPAFAGEIAGLAANMIAKREPYRQAVVGNSLRCPIWAMANWVTNADKIVHIDGCFLRCHGPLLENLVEKEKLVQFDALSHYQKYTDLFDRDAAPEAKRIETARPVVNWVLAELENKRPARQTA